MRSKKSCFYLLFLTLFLTFNLISCGGGGGGGSAVSSPLLSENFSSFNENDVFTSSSWTRQDGTALPNWHIRETAKALTLDDNAGVTWIVYNGTGSESWTDYSIAFDFKVTDINVYASVYFRFIGGGEPGLSYYFVNIYDGNKLGLGKCPSDSSASYGPDSATISYSADTYYPVRIDVSGNNIKVYFNGAATPDIDWTDDGSTYGALQPAGSIGLGSPNSNATNYVFFDNIIVSPI